MVNREDGWGPCHSKHTACSLLIAVWISMIGLVGSCKLESCLNEYSSGLEQGLKSTESPDEYCQHLKSYGSCVRAASKNCRGDLQYHTTWSIVSTLTKRFNCSRYRQRPQRQECSYFGRQNYSSCTLYGRPHLVTFFANYHNCKFEEYTSLLDNQFFSVIVTRGNLDSQSYLVSQINITIKTGGTPCASMKQYIAHANRDLPTSFIDGTQSSGVKNSVLLNSTWDGTTETVYIYLRYIDTTMVVKKSGSYIGFSCRMPSDILSFDPGSFELCRNGCTDKDMMDFESARIEQKVWRTASMRCSHITRVVNSSSDRNFWRDRDLCLFQVMSSSSATSRTTPLVEDTTNVPTEPRSKLPVNVTSTTPVGETIERVVILSKGNFIRFTPLLMAFSPIMYYIYFNLFY